jgi:hypothetical protein
LRAGAIINLAGAVNLGGALRFKTIPDDLRSDMPDAEIRAARKSRQHHHIVAVGRERRRERAADEPRAAGDDDSHQRKLNTRLSRYRRSFRRSRASSR